MPRSKILLEAGPMIDGQKSGVGYYVEGLTKSLAQYHPGELELTGYFFNFLRRKHKPSPSIKGVRFHVVTLVPGKLLSLCRRLGFQPPLELFVRDPADTVLYTNYVMLPTLRKRKRALVVYDLSFLDHPEYTQKKNLAFLRRFAVASINKADLIITISEFTSRRIEHYFPELRAPVVVAPIPPTALDQMSVELSPKLSQKAIVSGKYILQVGTIEPRKNLQNLMKAYGMLRPDLRDQYSLVLAGGNGWKNEAILQQVEDYQAQGFRIVLTGYVTAVEKAALYQHAACTVLVSHYEGFGMPVLEAMQQGSPLVVSDIDVFHEVAGPAASYCDKDDPNAIAAAVAQVLDSSDQRAALVASGKRRLKDFGWQKTADTISQALVKLARD